MLTKTRATIEDLYKVDGKAELINGEIKEFIATGYEPGYATVEIVVALRSYARQTGASWNMPVADLFAPD